MTHKKLKSPSKENKKMAVQILLLCKPINDQKVGGLDKTWTCLHAALQHIKFGSKCGVYLCTNVRQNFL
jgi:hypothetical protein